ncbi:hypothetical protein [Streptomyces canus]|uniref:hypothetical protein n=1 Tax=Streptomyces canus TaxID=58343 RepID=UPI00386FC373
MYLAAEATVCAQLFQTAVRGDSLTRRRRPAGLLPDTLTDRGNAKLFVKLYANDYRHIPKIGWYGWDTTRWQIDEDDSILWAAGGLAENIATNDPRGLFTTTALHKHRTRALSTTGLLDTVDDQDLTDAVVTVDALYAPTPPTSLISARWLPNGQAHSIQQFVDRI